MTFSEAVKSYGRELNRYRYFTIIAYGLLISACLAVGVWGYKFYNRSAGERAHGVLAQAVELYQRAERENTEALWNDTELALSQGYQQFSGSAVAPYFLALQSEVAFNKGDFEKARDFLSQALTVMKKSSPLYPAYAIKLALMKIDAGDAAGREELQALANSTDSQGRDMALYYQGVIDFDSGDRAGAEKAWSVLIKDFGSDSVWAQAAKQQLDYTA